MMARVMANLHLHISRLCFICSANHDVATGKAETEFFFFRFGPNYKQTHLPCQSLGFEASVISTLQMKLPLREIPEVFTSVSKIRLETIK